MRMLLHSWRARICWERRGGKEMVGRGIEEREKGEGSEWIKEKGGKWKGRGKGREGKESGNTPSINLCANPALGALAFAAVSRTPVVPVGGHACGKFVGIWSKVRRFLCVCVWGRVMFHKRIYHFKISSMFWSTHADVVKISGRSVNRTTQMTIRRFLEISLALVEDTDRRAAVNSLQTELVINCTRSNSERPKT